MKIDHFIPENPPISVIPIKIHNLIMPFKPLVGSSNLPTLIMLLIGSDEMENGGIGTRYWLSPYRKVINERDMLIVSNGEATTGNVALKSTIRNSDWIRRKKGRHFLLTYKK